MIKGYKPIYAMDQHKVLGNDQVWKALYDAPKTNPKRNGICQGLSMAWIHRVIKNHKETPDQRQKAFLGPKGTGDLVMFQRGGDAQDLALAGSAAFSAVQGSEPYYTQRYGKALAVYGLHYIPNSGKLVSGQHLSVDEMAKVISEWSVIENRGYRVYGVAWQQDGGLAGHFCASYVSSGKIFGFGRHLYFFDSNEGEYKIDLGRESGKFFTQWLKTYSDSELKRPVYVESFAVRG
jgi:hypothetical protein